MPVTYSKNAIDTVVRHILRFKAGDKSAGDVGVQLLSDESVAALEEACRKKKLYGKVGWDVYHDVSSLAYRFFPVSLLARYLTVEARDFETHITLSFRVKMDPAAAAQEAFRMSENEAEIVAAKKQKLKAFISENHLIPLEGTTSYVVFRTEEDKEAYLEKKQAAAVEKNRWRNEFDANVKAAFSKLAHGITGENAVVSVTMPKYKHPVYVAVHSDGHVIAWCACSFQSKNDKKVSITSMCDSEGIVLSNEEMSPPDSWFDGASAGYAKDYIDAGGNFGQYIPTDVNPLFLKG